MILNVTVAGASHKDTGKECQDYSLTWQNRSGSTRIAVVSDGHGGEEYFNSALGARLACRIAVATLREFARNISKLPHRHQESHVKTLCASILTRWHDAVEAARGSDSVRSFGCTLIAYLQTCNYWLALQIGDGKFVTLDEKGNWSQPVPWDDRCILNYTTSMCDDGALSEFRYAIGRNAPTAVFLSSDGIDNTFEDGALLYNFYAHVLHSILTDGIDSTRTTLPDALAHFSEVGSRDDMSVAIIIN